MIRKFCDACGIEDTTKEINHCFLNFFQGELCKKCKKRGKGIEKDYLKEMETRRKEIIGEFIK